MTSPLDEAEYARLAALFEEVNSSAQTLHAGFLNVTSDVSASVQLVWSKRDLINNAAVKFHAQYHVSGLSSGSPSVSGGLVPASWDYALTSVSPSKRFVVALKLDKAEAGSAPEGVFSVFDNGELVHVFKAPKTLHGGIYTGEREGGIAWTQDETKIAYVAEKKQPDATPFFENINSKKEKKKESEEESTEANASPLPGTKYEHQDDWGEQYVGKKTGAIFIATLVTGKIEEVKGIPANLTCANVAFTPRDKGLVFAGTEVDSPKRLGIIYCYNRPITLYHIVLETDATAEKLALLATDEPSKLIASIRSPRFSPDGKKLAFLATRDVVTHATCSFLAVMDWETKQTTTIIDVVEEPQPQFMEKPTTSFNGLFIGSLSEKCWSKDSKLIFFDTQLGARTVWKYVDVATKQLFHPSYVDGDRVATETVLDRAPNGWVMVSVASPVRAASVYLIRIDVTTGKYLGSPVVIVDQTTKAKYVGDWKVLAVPTSVSDTPAAKKAQIEPSDVLKPHLLPLTTSSSDFEAMVWLPKAAPPSDKGYPVVLDVHGGPHGSSPVTYRVMYEYIVALGFAIVSINYRGSTGYGLRPLESLIGRVGTQDVYDSHYGLLHVFETSGLPLNKDQVHCSGGSHGGFLVAHFVTQFPGFYKSTVARNPVTNITSQFFTSDIPDWGLAVTGVARFDAVHTTLALQKQHKEKTLAPLTPEARAAILAKWWQHSPMSNDLAKVSTPVLFGIGGKDRRVPPTQGIEFRDALRSLGVETRTLWYPEDCHPLGTLQAFGDFSVNWGAWLLQHTQ